ncbi:MAG: hypothetical protein ACOZAO_01240 [Patescibacteria group bacterium]
MLKTIRNKKTILVSLGIYYFNTLLLLMLPQQAYAQCTDPDTCDLGDLIRSVYDVARPLAIIFGFIMILVAGYKITTSQGDPMKVKVAKEDMSSAILGLIFVLIAVGFLRMILNNL